MGCYPSKCKMHPSFSPEISLGGINPKINLCVCVCVLCTYKDTQQSTVYNRGSWLVHVPFSPILGPLLIKSPASLTQTILSDLPLFRLLPTASTVARVIFLKHKPDYFILLLKTPPVSFHPGKNKIYTIYPGL